MNCPKIYSQLVGNVLKYWELQPSKKNHSNISQPYKPATTKGFRHNL